MATKCTNEVVDTVQCSKRGSELRGHSPSGRRIDAGLSIIYRCSSSSITCLVLPFNDITQPVPTMERRRAELEEKRRKLEEMKRAREERMSATAALRRTVAAPTSTTSIADAIQTPYRGNRQQVDDLLNNILGQPTPSVPTSGGTSRPGSSLSGAYPKTPGPVYRNQGVQDVPETPVAGTSRELGVSTQVRPQNATFECVGCEREHLVVILIDLCRSSIPESTQESGPDQSEGGDKTMDFIDAHEELFELPQQVSISSLSVTRLLTCLDCEDGTRYIFPRRSNSSRNRRRQYQRSRSSRESGRTGNRG